MSTSVQLEGLLAALTEGGQPLIISLPIAATLWAISVAQTWRYYKTYPGDLPVLKYYIGVCLVLNTLIFAGSSWNAYYWLIHLRLPIHYSELGALEQMPGLQIANYGTSIMTAAVQCFYTARVWILSNRNVYLALFLLTMILGALSESTGVNYGVNYVFMSVLVSAIVVSVQLSISGLFFNIYDHSSEILQSATFICSLICDGTICFSLALFLNRRKKEAVKSTQSAIVQLILYAVNIGLVTSITTILNLVTWKTVA
ncbi:hypothetical protein M422DRAFT_783251, partial [Sphaerobolus stellatus SS14]